MSGPLNCNRSNDHCELFESIIRINAASCCGVYKKAVPINISAQKNAACNLFGDGVISRAAFNQINTVILLLAVCRPTVGRHLSLQQRKMSIVGRLSANCRPTMDQLLADGQQSTNRRPTVGRLSAGRLYLVGTVLHFYLKIYMEMNIRALNL